MEQLDGTLGLEKKRLTRPAISSDQSTVINGQKPWTFLLDTNNMPSLKDRENKENPRVTMEFTAEVTVTGFKLQGSTNRDVTIQFILLAKRKLDKTPAVVKDVSGEALVSGVFLIRNSPQNPLIVLRKRSNCI